MQETGDIELLRHYAREGSEEAFAALVNRHVNLVYFAALRKTNNAQAAEEITQAVFIILAKKAHQLRRGTILSGWLYQTARLTTASFLRTELRRARREQEAYVQSLLNEPESGTWPEIAPLLEDSMGVLGEKERNAIVLRFFEGKSFQEVGAAFGASENAAKKRVARALEKLRKYFSKRGVVSTTAVIAGEITANSVSAAPVALAKSVTAVAIAKGAAASASTLTLINGALKFMTWTKVKTTIVIGAATILAVGTTMLAVKAATTANNQTLTLKVNPDLFIRNILAQRAETMNSPSNSWGDIFLDMMQIQGVDCVPPHGIALNAKTGEITTQNTPEALKKFRQSVEELNQPEGRCHFATRVPVRQAIRVTASFYKMSSSDFEKLGLDKGMIARHEPSDCWELEPKQLSKLREKLKSDASEPFQSPRVETGYGIETSLYVGGTTNHLRFDCLPMGRINGQWIDIKLQASTTGVFTRDPAGDWPNYAGRTNCALFAEDAVENGGGLVFRSQNSASSSMDNNLVVVAEVSAKSGPE